MTFLVNNIIIKTTVIFITPLEDKKTKNILIENRKLNKIYVNNN